MNEVIEAQRQLQRKIRQQGQVLEGNMLKVDSFLNHKISPFLLNRIGAALAQVFKGLKVTKVLTAEAAGNVIAYETAKKLSDPDEVEAVYAKKGVPDTMNEEQTKIIRSPTKKTETTLALCSNYFSSQDRVLVVDDFLFTGRTAKALIEMVGSNSTIVGAGFAICKKEAKGYERLKEMGVLNFSLVNIMQMSESKIEFLNPQTQTHPKEG